MTKTSFKLNRLLILTILSFLFLPQAQSAYAQSIYAQKRIFLGLERIIEQGMQNQADIEKLVENLVSKKERSVKLQNSRIIVNRILEPKPQWQNLDTATQKKVLKLYEPFMSQDIPFGQAQYEVPSQWLNADPDIWNILVELAPILPGDIVAWIPKHANLLTAAFLCGGWPPVYHTDIVDWSIVMLHTSSPNNGCAHMSSWRFGSNLGCVILRKKDITPQEIVNILLKAYLTPCIYDWSNYYIGWARFFGECLCKDCRLFRNFPPKWWFFYHCASFCAHCWEMDNPHTIYAHEVANHPDVIIVYWDAILDLLAEYFENEIKGQGIVEPEESLIKEAKQELIRQLIKGLPDDLTTS